MNDEELETWGKHVLAKITKSRMPEMQNFNTFVNALVARTNNNEDGVIAVTGDRGKGKTTFSLNACLMMRMLLPRTNGPAFTWDNICYRYDGIGDIIEKAGDKDQQVYTIDEAIDVAHSKDAMSRVNKELGKFMIKARKKRNLYFWNIPDFTDLDAGIRNKVIQYWVHVFYRDVGNDKASSYSMAALLRKNLNPFERDKWGFETNSRLVNTPVHDVAGLMELFHKSQNFVAFIAFPPLPKVIEESYLVPSYDALRASSKEFNLNLRTQRNQQLPQPQKTE